MEENFGRNKKLVAKRNYQNKIIEVRISKSKSKNGEIRYILEKSSTVVYKLITGKGDARRRLRENEMELKFALLFDVPDHLKELKKE
jgi:hypothetical protein